MSTTTATHPAPSSPGARRRWSWREVAVPAAFVVVVTGFGSAAAAIGSSLEPQVSAPPVAQPAWWPPLSLFWAVWLVIYPCSALAAWRVWQQRRRHDVRGALTAFAIVNASSALFLPVSSLVGDVPSVMTLMDLNGVFAVAALTWLFSRSSRSAALWMLPYLLWMPTTSVLKALLWQYNA